MENYSKGKNVEEPMERDKLPIPNLPKDFLWMQVKGGSRMRNLLEPALKAGIEQKKTVVWTGQGAAVQKAIGCAEVMKAKTKAFHQFNTIHYARVEEHWDPKLEGLDPLVVIRDVPVIHIVLSHEPLNQDLPGYQGPEGSVKGRRNFQEGRKGGRGGKQAVDPEKMAAMGLRTAKAARKHYNPARLHRDSHP